MSSEIKMSVSSMTRTKDSKAVYVMFSDNEKTAEFSLPGVNLISNRGFSDEEIDQLKEYMANSMDDIYEVAKKVNPMKGFMGAEQGK